MKERREERKQTVAVGREETVLAAKIKDLIVAGELGHETAMEGGAGDFDVFHVKTDITAWCGSNRADGELLVILQSVDISDPRSNWLSSDRHIDDLFLHLPIKQQVSTFCQYHITSHYTTTWV